MSDSSITTLIPFRFLHTQEGSAHTVTCEALGVEGRGATETEALQQLARSLDHCVRLGLAKGTLPELLRTLQAISPERPFPSEVTLDPGGFRLDRERSELLLPMAASDGFSTGGFVEAEEREFEAVQPTETKHAISAWEYAVILGMAALVGACFGFWMGWAVGWDAGLQRASAHIRTSR